MRVRRTVERATRPKLLAASFEYLRTSATLQTSLVIWVALVLNIHKMNYLLLVEFSTISLGEF